MHTEHGSFLYSAHKQNSVFCKTMEIGGDAIPQALLLLAFYLAVFHTHFQYKAEMRINCVLEKRSKEARTFSYCVHCGSRSS